MRNFVDHGIFEVSQKFYPYLSVSDVILIFKPVVLLSRNVENVGNVGESGGLIRGASYVRTAFCILQYLS